MELVELGVDFIMDCGLWTLGCKERGREGGWERENVKMMLLLPFNVSDAHLTQFKSSTTLDYQFAVRFQLRIFLQ